MKNIIKTISALSLIVIVLAPALFYANRITLEMNKTLMLVATVTWFASALCWMGREKEST